MIECRNDGCRMPALHAGQCRAHLNERLSKPSTRRIYDSPETREARKLAQYGIEPAEYWAMHERQGGLCAICRRPESVMNRALAVDHDHETGAVRGLLCGRCNQALGLLGDDAERVTAAAGYLREHAAR